MSVTAIVMMTVYLLVVWGLLVVASIHLGRTTDESTGTLGDQILEEMPLYTKSEK